MKGKIVFVCAVGFALGSAASVQAQQDSLINHVQTLLDSISLVEGQIFAPNNFAKAEKKFAEAKRAIESGRKPGTIEKYLMEAAEFAEQTLSAAGTGRLTLEEYLDPRSRARQAGAPILVPELYEKAEKQFLKATDKVESGDVKGGLKEAAMAAPLFDVAEFEAIRIDIMGTADQLIETAIQGEAAKFALSTLDKARTARQKCDAILTRDRYERAESIAEIRRAEYEARHALNIATRVRSLERNDQAWEKLIQSYEIEMNRVAEEIGVGTLAFDKGAGAAADSLIYHIRHLHTQSTSSEQLNRRVTDGLRAVLERLGADQQSPDPLILVDRINMEVGDLLAGREQLAAELDQKDSRLQQLRTDHEQVAAELEARTALEGKFKKAKTILTPAEGEVLFNASNDIVLRLSGLSFDINKSDIKDEHVPLLEKVKSVIEMFPDSRLIVEGHTDASGDAAANAALSEKRAYAVMQYLRQSLLIGADRITAIGYGSDKPVASNQTPEGRAKNRRIDILIMQ